MKKLMILMIVVCSCTLILTGIVYGNNINSQQASVRKLSEDEIKALKIPTFRPKSDKVKFIKEPDRKKELDANTKWNPYKGEYYNSDSFEWDPVEGQYVDKVLKKQIKKSNNSNSKKDIVKEFIEVNENTDNELNKAIIKYLKERDIKLDLKSYYNPDEDEAFKNNLGHISTEYLPDMIQYVNEDKFSILMMHSIARNAKVKELDNVSLTPEGLEKWKADLSDIRSKASKIVKDTSDKLKKSNNMDKSLDLSKNEVKKLGMFAVPYLVDEINQSNDDALISLLEEIVNSEGQKVKAKDWIKDNSDNIKTLKALTANDEDK